ncbi:DUF86 domain-containing protein [Lacihabitans sp. CCS-44]|uniref:HepT-like ribonuclease domain-containing protein n=1 Tax=Lacihabitans sp. CCS-44 TaxID=2487331 RepID=UPI0020CDACF4|nr:HepT-like ribonuclease domain-containing protein [Lacihabitans sp. CCS-44]MCP9757514.1 DUF86 domain-containing protein [Lacihabitans sp. CCS-44]
MDDKIKKYLFDIKISIGRIESFLDTNRDFESYAKDILLQNAVERNLEIIGEAVNKILKIEPNFPLTDARKIVDTRNKISHGYDEIEPENIWFILIRHVPILKKEVEDFLKNK